MKKILAFIILALFIPLIINAETCDNDKITLELLANETHYEGNVTVKSDPVINGKNINVDLVMFDQGDAVEYVFDIINNSNEDYEIDKNSFNINSDYINYSLNLEDNSTIVKSGQRKRAALLVEYANPVPTDTLLAGPVTDNKTITVNLSTGSEIENPKNGVESLLIAFVLTLSVSSIALFILNKKGYATLIIIIGVAVVIPVTIHAACKVELKLTSNVEITKFQEFCFIDTREGHEGTKYYRYEHGMTFKDYVDSSYFKAEDWAERMGSGAIYRFPSVFLRPDGSIVNFITDEAISNELGIFIPQFVIRPKEEGCYKFVAL